MNHEKEQLVNEENPSGDDGAGLPAPSALSCDDCQAIKHWDAAVPYVNVLLCPEHATASAEIKRLEAVNAALLDALEFYADPRKYKGGNCRADPDEESVAGYYRLDVSRDGGDKARAAISLKDQDQG